MNRTAQDLAKDWQTNPRWKGVQRAYKAEDVVRLRGTVHVEHSIARLGAEKLWRYVNEKPFVNALGALTGNQAMQQVKAGLDAIYLSGWQVAGDANLSGQMYPDQSLYPADSVPAVVKRINSTLKRADELHHAEGNDSIDWFKPIVADAEAGFGGVLNAFELMKQMIEAGRGGRALRRSAVLREEVRAHGRQGAGAHAGGNQQARRGASRRRRVRRADGAGRAHRCRIGQPAHLRRGRARPALHRLQGAHCRRFLPRQAGAGCGRGARHCVCAVRGHDLVRDGAPGSRGSEAICRSAAQEVPGKMLAYNCSPSFNWKKKLDDATIAKFQRELGAMGYKFQFITLAGFHALNYSMFQLARGYKESQMTAYVKLQQEEFGAEGVGYTATKHQREVGAGYFDDVTQTVSAGNSSLSALKGSTEEAQFIKS